MGRIDSVSQNPLTSAIPTWTSSRVPQPTLCFPSPSSNRSSYPGLSQEWEHIAWAVTPVLRNAPTHRCTGKPLFPVVLGWPCTSFLVPILRLAVSAAVTAMHRRSSASTCFTHFMVQDMSLLVMFLRHDLKDEPGIKSGHLAGEWTFLTARSCVLKQLGCSLLDCLSQFLYKICLWKESWLLVWMKKNEEPHRG